MVHSNGSWRANFGEEVAELNHSYESYHVRLSNDQAQAPLHGIPLLHRTLLQKFICTIEIQVALTIALSVPEQLC